jgi:prepilin-type N-terminal cleavage/methylation domain-containing protein
MVARPAGPRNRRGFTLIELLIVVVIIGILAAIAIPKFRNTKGKAFLSAMKSDLRNLATAQEAYFYEYQTYSADTALMNFHPSSGVLLDIQSADPAGWGAVVTHPQAYPVRCALFMGSHTTAPASNEGLIACDGL